MENHAILWLLNCTNRVLLVHCRRICVCACACARLPKIGDCSTAVCCFGFNFYPTHSFIFCCSSSSLRSEAPVPVRSTPSLCLRPLCTTRKSTLVSSATTSWTRNQSASSRATIGSIKRCGVVRRSTATVVVVIYAVCYS